jgi:hypothetical protein
MEVISSTRPLVLVLSIFLSMLKCDCLMEMMPALFALFLKNCRDSLAKF